LFFNRSNIAFFLLCLIVGGVAIMAINTASIYTPDSTRYLVWAKSIASLDGYQDATHPNPSRYVVHAPLYPVLLAPIARLFPYDILAAKMWTLCFGIALLTLLYVWLSRYVDKPTALVGCLFLGLNPMFLVYSTEVLSDVPFAAAMLLAMLCLERITATHEVKPWLLLALSLAISAGILLREVGFSLLFSVIVFLALRRRWKQVFLIALLPIAMYAIWYVRNEMIVAPFESSEITNARLFTHHFFTSPQDSLFSEILARIVNNISVYGKGIGKILIFPFHGFMQYDVVFVERFPLSLVYAVLDVAGYVLIAFTAGITVYGMMIDVRESTTAVFRLLVICFYLLIVLVYPVNDVRFMLPLLVLVLFYGSLSFSHFVKRIPRRDKPSFLLRASPAIILVACGIPNFVWDSQFIANSFSYKRSPLGFYQSTVGLQRYPSHFTMPLDLAGKWLADHSDTSARA
jgi:4-amino-4-deoxy-L-arabinose transferase-like glycosyltransferase